MSKFLSYRYQELEPYVPGEQPRDKKYIKLNTNELPYPPSAKAIDAISKAAIEGLNLYSDPTSLLLRRAIARNFCLEDNQIIATNGSDEALALAFMAYLGNGASIAMPDISYGFYPVLCNLLNVDSEIIKLKDDFTIDIDAFCATDKTIVIANPNAPTGIALSLSNMERIISANMHRIVIVDEAYVDFGGESCISLINKYPNLLVVQTFSKSRCLAGARIGFAAGQKELIADLDKLRNSLNPYNINTLSAILGVAAIEDTAYLKTCVSQTIKVREFTKNALKSLGFEVLPSCANFLFARHKKVSGKTLYLTLKNEGILIRYFNVDRISDFVRISIGTLEQMNNFIEKLEKILKGEISLCE